MQRAPKTGQRIRLSAQIESPAVIGGVFNLCHEDGNIARAYTREGNVWFTRGDRAQPPYDFERAATATGDAFEGCFAWDPRGFVRLLYTKTGSAPGVYEIRGYNYGTSWTGGSQLRAQASHPDIVRDLVDGFLLRSYYRAGSLWGVHQAPGNITPLAEFEMEDGAAPLAVADDSHRIAQDASGQYWLHVRLDAAMDTTLHYSNDRGETWAPTDGGVPGISGGRRPGICHLAEGGLVAWAIVGGNTIEMTRRGPGDTAWSTPVVVEDDAGTLAVTDSSASMADSPEHPGRLWLALVCAGETTPCDLYSKDLSESFKLLAL
jgi:hypothetical protein